MALGIAPEARPVYGYLGDLHPALGTVGLVIERSWLRALIGVTRCDTGGLVGRRGSFEVLDTMQATDAVRALTFSGPSLSAWESAFEVEVASSYQREVPGYVNGDEPDVSTWDDPRADCFRRATPPRDRRLWTWEVRCDRGPEPGEVMAIALSRSAAAALEDLHRRGSEVPDTVRILYGSNTREGSQFHEPSVRTLLAGGG